MGLRIPVRVFKNLTVNGRRRGSKRGHRSSSWGGCSIYLSIFLNQFYVNIYKKGYGNEIWRTILFSPKNNIRTNYIFILYMLSILAYPIPDNLTNEFVKKETKQIISYKEYRQNPFVLSKLKLPELKSIARSLKLPVSGNKRSIYDRIQEYFEKCSHAIKIQKVFRGFLLRLLNKIRGEGWKNIMDCVNDSDFYSLEPLKEIPIENFFSFQIGKFIYGCNILSLIHLMKTKTVIKNPYNRENIPVEIIKDILRVYRLIKIIYGLPKDAPVVSNYSILHIQERTRRETPSNELIDRIPNGLSNGFIQELQNKMRTIREKPLNTRIQELFMEIDQLGNYTHPVWFSSLSLREYIRFFRTLYEIWTVRGGLTREVKSSICVLYDPFIEIRREQINISESTLEVVCDCCLRVMESMVYCGIDIEYKKIGALHVLTALTNVSIGARASLHWLYESIF